MEYWYILGIEPTKDIDEIRAAYKVKLKSNHPEDNPEGFKALRDAYDKAMAYAQSEEEEIQFEDSPMGNWEKKLNETYENYLDRISVEKWQKLLSDNVMIALDTRTEAEDKLLGFLMQHHLLPRKIWQLIVAELDVKENKEELKERYPDDFLDYMINNATYRDNFNYDLFEQRDSSLPYEEFIKLYFKFKSAFSEQNMDEVKLDLEALDAMPLTHPYLTIGKINFMIWNEQKEEALAEAEELYQEYNDEPECGVCYASVLYALERYQEAFEIYKSVEECEGSEYTSRCGQADCYFGMGDFKSAQKIYKELLMIRHYDGYVHYRLTLCNDGLINQYQERLEADAGDDDARIELCWCMYQNNRMQEAYDLVKDHDSEGIYGLDYAYLKGRCLYNLNRYEEAREWFLRWLELYPICEDAEGEPGKRNRDRRELTYYFLAEIENQFKNYEKAYEYNEYAVQYTHVDQDLILTQKGIILKKLYDYKAAEQILLEALDASYDNVQAMIGLAEIYRDTGRLQTAVNYFERAIYTLPYLPEGYSKLLKLYIDEEVYDMADDLLNQFRQGDVKSYAVDYCEALIRNNKGDYDKAAEVIKGIDEDNPDQNINDLSYITDKNDFIYEKVNILLDAGQMSDEQAIKQIKKLIKAEPDNAMYIYFLARLLSRTGDEQAALKNFKKTLKLRPDNEAVLSAVAESYRNLNDEKEINYLIKLFKINPEHPYVNGRMGDYYETRKQLEKALDCYNRQLEIRPSGYYYISRGIVYMELFEGAKALEDFTSAIETEPENPYSYYNMGRELMRQERDEEAVEYLEKAVELTGKSNNRIIFTQLSRCYARLRDKLPDFETRLDTLVEKMKTAMPYSSRPYYLKARIRRSMGLWQEAMELFRQGGVVEKNSFDEMEAEAIETLIDFTQDVPKAKKLIAKRKGKGNDNFYNWVEQNINRYFELTSNQYKLYTKKPPSGEGGHYFYAICCKKLSQSRKLADKNKLMAEYEQHLDLAEDKAKNMIKTGSDAKQGYRRLVMIYIERGELEKAAKYLECMDKAPVCDFCITCKCYELYTCRASLEMALGHKEEALKYVEIAEKICCEDLDVALLRKEIEKM